LLREVEIPRAQLEPRAGRVPSISIADGRLRFDTTTKMELRETSQPHPQYLTLPIWAHEAHGLGPVLPACVCVFRCRGKSLDHSGTAGRGDADRGYDRQEREHGDCGH